VAEVAQASPWPRSGAAPIAQQGHPQGPGIRRGTGERRGGPGGGHGRGRGSGRAGVDERVGVHHGSGVLCWEVGRNATRSPTGLLTPAIVDQASGATPIDRYQPKVVVVLLKTATTPTATSGPAPTANRWRTDYGPAFFTEWGIQAEKFTTLLSSRGAQVDWVLPPPLAGPEGARRQAGLRATYEELQARVPAITLIDGAPWAARTASGCGAGRASTAARSRSAPATACTSPTTGAG
jgi:hypothetical protein